MISTAQHGLDHNFLVYSVFLCETHRECRVKCERAGKYRGPISILLDYRVDTGAGIAVGFSVTGYSWLFQHFNSTVIYRVRNQVCPRFRRMSKYLAGTNPYAAISPWRQAGPSLAFLSLPVTLSRCIEGCCIASLPVRLPLDGDAYINSFDFAKMPRQPDEMR